MIIYHYLNDVLSIIYLYSIATTVVFYLIFDGYVFLTHEFPSRILWRKNEPRHFDPIFPNRYHCRAPILLNAQTLFGQRRLPIPALANSQLPPPQPCAIELPHPFHWPARQYANAAISS
jgi:hypothetical protein